MNEDEELIIRRFKELADRSYKNNSYTCSSFLNMMEIDLFYRIQREVRHVDYSLFGGREDSERKLLRFGSADMLGYEEPYPIRVVSVKPLLAKFADELTHRDFLGALLNLGIERSTVGDILIDNNEADIYCLETMAEFIADELTKVKHTNVKCRILEPGEVEEKAHVVRFESISESVSSERADLIIAKLCKLSRSEVTELFRAKQIFVNSRLTENNSQLLRKGDILSVRGHGRYIYDGINYQNKKGKNNITIRRYV